MGDKMKKRVYLYCIMLFLVSVFIFIHNVMYPFLTDRLMLFFLPPLYYGWMSWISLGIFVALMIVIRLLFKCDTKYHILYIVTLLDLFFIMSLSLTVGYNHDTHELYFYSGYPRLWVYLPMVIFSLLLMFVLTKFARHLGKGKLAILLWVVDFLYIFIYSFALFISVFSGQ